MNDKNYTYQEVSEIPIKDFNEIFNNEKVSKTKRVNQGEKSAEEVLAMI